MAMPVRVGALAKNPVVLLIRPILPEHPVRSTESFSTCKINHAAIQYLLQY